MAHKDARRYRRINLQLPAQVTINAVDHYDGKLLNISPGDLAVQLDATVVQGDAVVVSIKGLDVIEGTVARVLPDGFAISFLLPKKRRVLLTEQLMIRANEQFNQGLGDRRASPRHRISPTKTVCRLEDGASLFVTIIDKSVEGIAVEAKRRPPIGSDIHVGSRRGVVVRHTPRGFAVLFDAQAAEQAHPALRAV